MERELFSTQYPGDVNDPWPIYQAKKIIWRHKNFQEKIFDPIEQSLIELKYGNRVQAIDDFVENILKTHPWSVFIYNHEMTPRQQFILEGIAPIDYQKDTYPIGQWHNFIQILLTTQLHKRIPGLTNTTTEIFTKAELATPPNSNLRILNNFYFAFYGSLPKTDNDDLKRACWKFKKTQRKIIKTILGDETCQRLHTLLDYRNWVLFGNNYAIRHELTKKLIKQPLGEELKLAKTNYKKQKTEANLLLLEQTIAQRAIDLLFPNQQSKDSTE